MIKETLKQIPTKFRRTYRNILKIYNIANWKIKKKLINFSTHTATRNLSKRTSII
jgi:hypothetical protein